MDEHTPNPNPETAAESDGVGSPAGVEHDASESPPVDPQAELQDLDASLSEMTNLLLSGEDDDPFDIEGDFADADGVVAAARPSPQPDLQPGLERDPPPDPLAELDQVQAAVDAALEEAAGNLGDAPELDDAAAEATGRESATGDAPGTEAPTDELGECEPDGQEFEDRASDDPEPQADEPSMTEPDGPADGADFEPPLEAEPGAADPSVDPDAAMEAVSESLEDQVAESGPSDAAVEAPDEAEAASETEAESESPAEPEPAEPMEAAPEAHPEAQAEKAPTPIPAPAATQAAAVAAPAGGQSGSLAGAAPRKTAPKPAAKASFKTRLLAIAGPITTAVGARAGDLLARGIEPLAASLAEQPKVMRHSLAWLALWTAFNAGGIWTYLVFFRSTGPQLDPAAMTQISGSEAAPGSEGEGTPGGPGSPPPAGTIDPATPVLVSPAGR